MGQDILSYPVEDSHRGTTANSPSRTWDDYLEGTGRLKWDVEVMADLEANSAWTSPNSFPLTYDPTTGKVTVSGDHEDKEIIDQYFEDNPDKVGDFETIVQLGKLTATSRRKTLRRTC